MKTTITWLVPLLWALGASAPLLAQGIEWQTLNEEVMSLHGQGRYDRAAVVAKKALEVADETFGPNHSNVATSLGNLAVLYRETGRAKEAENLEERAAAIRAMRQ